MSGGEVQKGELIKRNNDGFGEVCIAILGTLYFLIIQYNRVRVMVPTSLGIHDEFCQAGGGFGLSFQYVYNRRDTYHDGKRIFV